MNAARLVAGGGKIEGRELGEIGLKAQRGLMTVPRLCDGGNVGT